MWGYSKECSSVTDARLARLWYCRGGLRETEPTIKIMRALANGDDPATGEPLQAGNFCLSAENVKALNTALSALVQQQQWERNRLSFSSLSAAPTVSAGQTATYNLDPRPLEMPIFQTAYRGRALPRLFLLLRHVRLQLRKSPSEGETATCC